MVEEALEAALLYGRATVGEARHGSTFGHGERGEDVPRGQDSAYGPFEEPATQQVDNVLALTRNVMKARGALTSGSKEGPMTANDLPDTVALVTEAGLIGGADLDPSVAVSESTGQGPKESRQRRVRNLPKGRRRQGC